MTRSTSLLLFILYVLVGLFVLNSSFNNFIPLPTAISGITSWINALGGILILVASFRYLRLMTSPYGYPAY